MLRLILPSFFLYFAALGIATADPATVPAGAPSDSLVWHITEVRPSATALPYNPQGLTQITVKMTTRPRRIAAVNALISPSNNLVSETIGTSTSQYNVTSALLNFCEDRTVFRKSCEIKLPDNLLDRSDENRLELKALGTVEAACIERQTVTRNSFGGWGSRTSTAEFVSDSFEQAGEPDMRFVSAPYECERHFVPFDINTTPQAMAGRISRCSTSINEALKTNSLRADGLEIRGIAADVPCNSQLWSQ